jgi:hypothetical protein
MLEQGRVVVEAELRAQPGQVGPDGCQFNSQVVRNLLEAQVTADPAQNQLLNQREAGIRSHMSRHRPGQRTQLDPHKCCLHRKEQLIQIAGLHQESVGSNLQKLLSGKPVGKGCQDHGAHRLFPGLEGADQPE